MKICKFIMDMETCKAGSTVKAVIENAEEIGSFTVEGILDPVPETLEKGTVYIRLHPDTRFKEMLCCYFNTIRKNLQSYPWGK
jgi:hypothetical protein